MSFWLKAAPTITEVPFSELEHTHELGDTKGTERFEIEEMVPALQDVMHDPLLQLETVETLEQELAYVEAGEWTQELQALEDRAFEQYLKKNQDQLVSQGMDSLKESFHKMFSTYVIGTLKDVIESAKMK